MTMSNEPYHRERTLHTAIHDEVAATAAADGKVDEILRAARQETCPLYRNRAVYLRR